MSEHTIKKNPSTMDLLEEFDKKSRAREKQEAARKGKKKKKPNLPNLGGEPKKKSTSKARSKLEAADRLLRERNFDPELNKALSKLPALGKGIKKGRVKFHAELPGVNSNRAYLGVRIGL